MLAEGNSTALFHNWHSIPLTGSLRWMSTQLPQYVRQGPSITSDKPKGGVVPGSLNWSRLYARKDDDDEDDDKARPF